LPTAASHSFYRSLNELLHEHGFDDFALPMRVPNHVHIRIHVSFLLIVACPACRSRSTCRDRQHEKRCPAVQAAAPYGPRSAPIAERGLGGRRWTIFF